MAKIGRPKGSRNKATADLKAAAVVYTKDMLRVLVSIANEGASEAARVAAAAAVLDRAHGKPAQAITGEGGSGPIKHSIKVEFVRP